MAIRLKSQKSSSASRCSYFHPNMPNQQLKSQHNTTHQLEHCPFTCGSRSTELEVATGHEREGTMQNGKALLAASEGNGPFRKPLSTSSLLLCFLLLSHSSLKLTKTTDSERNASKLRMAYRPHTPLLFTTYPVARAALPFFAELAAEH